MVARNIIAGAALLAASTCLHGCGSSGADPSTSDDPSAPPPATTVPQATTVPTTSVPPPATTVPQATPVTTTSVPPPATTVPQATPTTTTTTTATTVTTTTPTTTTTTPAPPAPSPCIALPPKPPVPDEVLDLNGHEYPEACYELKDENHFFVIGDWGGMCGWGAGNECAEDKWSERGEWSDSQGWYNATAPRPMWNRHAQYVPGIDDEAQQRVAAAMGAIAAQTPPEFVVSVGDHFYPGGVVEHCNGVGSTYDFSEVPHQFQSTFENVYNSTHMANAEWMGVLGNHDYGGVCVNMGWPQQIYYTWNQVYKRWVLPAQYYNRKLRFSKGGSDDWDEEDFTIDMFFLDSNHADSGSRDRNHDMCAREGNSDPTFYCDVFLGPDNSGQCAGTSGLWSSEHVCNDYFQQMWRDEMVWLEDLLDKSTADWQMIVTHFPPNYPTLSALTPLVEKYGVDLIMAGHSHLQQVWYQQKYINYDIGDTAWVISGGGGGVSSEGPPHEDYSKPGGRHSDRATGHDDQYGFMDMAISKDHLSIRPYSWGKRDDGSQVMRRGAEVSKRPRADLKDYRPVKPKAAELFV